CLLKILKLICKRGTRGLEKARGRALGDPQRGPEPPCTRPYLWLFRSRRAFHRSIESGWLGVDLIEDRPPRDGLSGMERKFATFTTLPYSFELRSRLFGSHLTRSQAGTTSVRGCYRSRRLLLPYASRRNAPTRAG